MTKRLVSNKLNLNNADNFVQSVTSYDDVFYVFAGKHTSYANNSDTVITQPEDSLRQNVIGVYDDMLFGKRVFASDVIKVVPRYDWTADFKYTQYDDIDATLATKPFYAVVNAGAQYLVYKCLFNNNSANSTVEPSGTDPNPFETPGDGYVWKYLYTVPDATMRKFSTENFMPVVPDQGVTANAVPGSIEVIAIDSDQSGSRYDNYFNGTFASAADIKLGGNDILYTIGIAASDLNDFYDTCTILITSGAATGESRTITNYVGSSREITLNTGFNNTVEPGDQFEITPTALVFDTGASKQTNCIARAIISSTTSNSVSKVEILDAGRGYRSAVVAIPTPNVVSSLTGFANASLRAVISPPGGHGFDVEEELYARHVCISVKFDQNESGYISADNDYRQLGVLKNPLFANVHIVTDPAEQVGNFAIGERVFSYTPSVLAGTAAVTSGNSTVAGTNTHFDNLVSGQPVLITNGTSNLFANVVTVFSNTSMSLSVNSTFTAAAASISLMNVAPMGVIVGNTSGITVNELAINNLTPQTLFSKIVGEESYATGVVDTGDVMPVSIGGIDVNLFSTFNQLTRYVGTLQGVTTFIEDETLLGPDSGIIYARPEAKFHSIINSNSLLYATNVKNIFPINQTMTGANSGAAMIISNKYDGQLVKDSGDVMYIQNVDPITRENNKSETVKLVLEY